MVFDVTHSLQLPGAGDGVTAGLAEYIEPLASAGVAAGVDAVFLEDARGADACQERRAECAAPRRARAAHQEARSASTRRRASAGRGPLWSRRMSGR